WGPRLWDQLEGSGVVFRLLGLTFALEGRRKRQLAVESQGQLIVLTWVEHHQGGGAHDPLEVAEKAACPEPWVPVAGAREGHQVMLLWLDRLGEKGKQSLWVKWTGECLLESVVALLPLHLDRFVEELACLQVVQHEVEQVDVLDPQAWLLPGNV